MDAQRVADHIFRLYIFNRIGLLLSILDQANIAINLACALIYGAKYPDIANAHYVGASD